jgi:hypothetical protein
MAIPKFRSHLRIRNIKILMEGVPWWPKGKVLIQNLGSIPSSNYILFKIKYQYDVTAA